MRPRDKRKNIEEVNKRLEESYLKSKNTKTQINEIAGLGVLALAGLSFAAPAIYDKVKKFWSKNVTSSKYKPTGNKETVTNEETKKQEIISEYKDKEGNLYWGYEHYHNPNPQMGDTTFNDDIYRAIFKASDKARLVKFLKGIKVKTSMPEMDYLDKPKPVDMILVKDLTGERMQNSGQ